MANSENHPLMEPLLLTPRDAAKALSICERTLYGLTAPRGDIPVIRIGMGEKSKNLKTVEAIFDKFLEFDLDRSSFAVGIGGGIVCDIAGFAASTFMRGIPFALVPTTLLAQADSSIGGKPAVNFQDYKNIIGVFNQPEFVLHDFSLLKSLPEEERLWGIAEIVKHALIANPLFFDYLETEWRALLKLEREVIRKAVTESILIKSRIVGSDAREGGERRKLNFGHTLGHALEKVNGIPHGKAVSLGMAVALRISAERGLLSGDEKKRIDTLLQRLGLLCGVPINVEQLTDAVRKDKKRYGEDVYFILLSGIGQAVVEKITWKELEKQIHYLYIHS